ncbi:hypothetical protein [Streptomyces sp. NPDC056883]|uniref:hypothetical protein n=1 Tax=Streptomyces sp. NPDC056883 TaxID=3345959 RepID=UPI0036884BF1
MSEEEVDAAIKLAETLSGTDMSELRDEYRDALEKLIQTKAAGTRPEPAEAPDPPSAQVVDLMAMLERSVSDAKAARWTRRHRPRPRRSRPRPRPRPRSSPRRRRRAANREAPECCRVSGGAALDANSVRLHACTLAGMTMGEQVDEEASRKASLRRARARDLILRVAPAVIADSVFDGFDMPDFLLDEIGIEVEAKATRLGSAWNSQHRLSLVERKLRDWLTAWEFFRPFKVGSDGLSLRRFHATAPEPEHDRVAALLVEAFGPIPLSERVAQLRREFRTADLAEKPEPAEVFGAYALSAGLLPPAVDVEPVAGGTFGELLIGHGYLVEPKAQPAARAHVDRIVAGLAALANLVTVWRVDLLRDIQQSLSPVAYAYTDHVPPVACSPCGVIRMASPLVPRGPELDLHLDVPSPSWALAA